jgi:hypothetical protein
MPLDRLGQPEAIKTRHVGCRPQAGESPPAGTTHQSPLTAEYEHDHECEYECIFDAAT